MPEFIEVTMAWNHKPESINVDDISSFTHAGDRTIEQYPRAKTTIFLRSQPCDDSVGIAVEESYDSIKETLRIRGINVFSAIPVEGPQHVTVPRAWLEAILPILGTFCGAQKPPKEGDPAGLACDKCPLGIGEDCVKIELPRLMKAEEVESDA
jgi:hypothetical protein